MASSNKRVMLFISILLVSFSLANSAATCPVDVLLSLDSCSNFATWLIGGGGDPTAGQCCRAIGGLDSRRAADCLCVILNGDLTGKNVDYTLGKVFNACKKPIPADYHCE